MEKATKTAWILAISVCLLANACQKERKEMVGNKSEILSIQANLVFFYYPDLDEAERFYGDVLGLERVLDYSSSPSGFIGLVDEIQGLHRFTPEKAVNVSFLTDQIDEWYTHLQVKRVKIKEQLENLESIPVKAFVGYDPAGYYIEFDQFLEDPKNKRILELLR